MCQAPVGSAPATRSIDSFYRETKEMTEYRREEGFGVVEMECAALAACAEFRNITFGHILFTADTLVDAKNYDERGWGINSNSLAIKLSLDAVCEL